MSRAIRGPEDYEPQAKRDYSRFDTRGFITQRGSMERGIVWDQIDAGERVVEGAADGMEDYVDVLDHNKIKERPDLPVPATTRLAPRALWTIPVLPVALVAITGPVSKTLDFQGGVLSLSFVLSGSYTVIIDAFPYKPKTVVLEVMP